MEDFNLESLNLDDLNSISGGGLTEERKEYFRLLFKQMKKAGLRAKKCLPNSMCLKSLTTLTKSGMNCKLLLSGVIVCITEVAK